MPVEDRGAVAQQCAAWVETPAVLFAGSGRETSLLEFFSNSFMPLWQLAVERGYADAEAYLTSDVAPEDTPWAMIQARPETYHAPWGYLFDYVTPHQWLLSQVLDRICSTVCRHW